MSTLYTDVHFKLPHIDIKGLRGGNPDGPFLLMLHGWLDNSHSFLPMLPYLDAFDWLAIDFPGHGHSGHRSADAPYYFVDWVYDVEALIREQGWRQIHVLGHSMGGYVAQLLAACFPERIQSLSTIESFGLVTAPPEKALTQLREGFSSRFKQLGRQLPVYSDLQHLRHARAKAGAFSEALADLLLQRNLKEVPGGYSWRTDPKVRAVSPFRFSDEHVPPILSGIEAPMCTVLGEQGHQTLVDAVSHGRTHVRQLTVQQVPGGHHCHMEYPKATADIVVAHFLSN